MGKITLLFFGPIRDLASRGSETVENPGSLNELKDQLYRNYPGLDGMHFQFSVNRRLVQGNRVLEDGDEVGLLPPFAGG